MQIEFSSVLFSVLSLVLMAIPGVLLAKFKMLPEKASEALSAVVLYGCQPFMVFMSFQGFEYTSEVGLNMLIVFGIAVVVHIVTFAVAALLFRNKEDIKTKTLRYASTFSNCGFMGFPFLAMLFNGNSAANEVIIYASVIITVFHIMNWTVGVYFMTGSFKEASVKKIVLNPCIIAVVVGLLLFVTVKKPIIEIAASGTVARDVLEKITASLDYLADAVTPLSMIVIGIKLAGIKPKQLFLDKRAYAASAVKLVVMPFISMLAVAFLPVSSAIKYAVFLLLSMPSATSTAMFALRFGGDADFSTVCVLLSTLLSIITLPLMFLVFNGVFGVSI